MVRASSQIWCCGCSLAARTVAAFPQPYPSWYNIGTPDEYERAVQDVQDRPDAFGLGQPVSAGERATP